MAEGAVHGGERVTRGPAVSVGRSETGRALAELSARGWAAAVGRAGQAARGGTGCGREWAWELAGPSGGVAKRAGLKSLDFAGKETAWAGPVWADGRSGLPAGKGERGAGWAAKRVWAGFWVH